MNDNKTTWLVIANAIEAGIYAIQGKTHSLVKSLTHPEGRLKSIEIAGDKAGSYHAGSGPRSHFEAPNSPHEEEHKLFAKEVAHFLEEHRQQHQYHDLIVCAEPHFHGLLNHAFTDSTRSLISQSIQKDYIPLPKEKMTSIIEEIIQAR